LPARKSLSLFLADVILLEHLCTASYQLCIDTLIFIDRVHALALALLVGQVLPLWEIHPI